MCVLQCTIDLLYIGEAIKTMSGASPVDTPYALMVPARECCLFMGYIYMLGPVLKKSREARLDCLDK